jgi:tyrosine-specific transport protein
MKEKINIKNVLSGSLLICGTTVGAGMLGIPVTSGKAGFIPAVCITVLVWLFMLITGLLFLEATLWMHKGANVLSITKKFLGRHAKVFSGGTFVFLYYCLMIAYFAGGAPLLASFIEPLLKIKLLPFESYAIFGVIFGVIVGIGMSFVDRVNYILMIGLVISFVCLITIGSEQVDVQRLEYRNWKHFLFIAPVLFSSFGYHNVIPSLTDHFKRNRKVMVLAIFIGTSIPLFIYLVWQWLIIGAVPPELIEETLSKGQTIIYALERLTGNRGIQLFGRFFGVFAIVTSMLGVSFSVVDFLGDGLKWERKGFKRFLLCLITFVPPFLFSVSDPSIFLLAIGVAGGFGEAFLNGILPAALVWRGRYHKKENSKPLVFGGRVLLVSVFLLAILVMFVEGYILFKR